MNAGKFIQDNKISVETVNQSFKDFIEDYLVKNDSAAFINIKNHIQTQSEKMTAPFTDLVQFCLDTKAKEYDETISAEVNIKHDLFTNQFNQTIRDTRYGFFAFIYEAWRHVLKNLYEEANREGNKRICDLTIVLLGEIIVAYKYVANENENNTPANGHRYSD